MSKAEVKISKNEEHMNAFVHNEDQSVAMHVTVRICCDGILRVHLTDLITDFTQSRSIGNIWTLSKEFNRDSVATLDKYFVREVERAIKSVEGK